MPSSAPTTLKDVARLAGVSVSTASKALSGGYSLRPTTLQRVRDAAESLSFVPNQMAQSLHTRRTGTVGLITSDLDGRFSLPILMGAEDRFGLGDVSIFLCDARGDVIRERHHLRALLNRRVDGLIVVGDTTNPRSSLGQDLPVPVVYAYAPSTDPADTSVVSDNVTSGRLAAQSLIAQGRSHIAYVGGDVTISATRDRVSGSGQVLAEHGMALVGGAASFGAWSEAWGRSAVGSLLSIDPDLDGVLCGNDVIARGVVEGARELGCDVPNQLSVIGHDDIELVAQQSSPQLTTVNMNLEHLGRRAAELLIEAMSGGSDPGIHAIAPRIVARGSTALKHGT